MYSSLLESLCSWLEEMQEKEDGRALMSEGAGVTFLELWRPKRKCQTAFATLWKDTKVIQEIEMNKSKKWNCLQNTNAIATISRQGGQKGEMSS